MSAVVRVTLADGQTLEVEQGSTCGEVASRIGPGLARAALAAYVNGELCSLEERIHRDGQLRVVTNQSPEAINCLRHSAAHLCAAAVLELFPEAQLGFGPPTESGFYYDFVVQRPFTPEDLERIEAHMRELAAEGLPFVRRELDPDAAGKELLRLGYKLKAEYLEELRQDGDIISFYSNGDRFTDMCRGGHVPSFGDISAFKLIAASGAYWRGEASGIPMQRIRGTAFFSQKELDAHLEMVEEAKKRDHRKLGPALGLFSFHEEAPGFVFWHTGGVIVWRELEELVREELTRRGYREIRTPQVLTDELWHRSGHFDHYRDHMYFVEKENRSFAVKPMNCPGACLVYRTALRSYKELPLKLAEFGFVHRYELSGVLHGLFRVRGFVQDDAHVYCTPEQIEDEVIDCLDMLDAVYGVLGFRDLDVKLSTRPDDRMGDDAVWDEAEAALEASLKRWGREWILAPKEGNFYGPKIDIDLTDSLGRKWQCGTFQLDFQMPERFGLEYVGADGRRHTPVMIHRAILGSVDRMMGVLVEHYGGKFPVWMAPVQAILLPITDKTLPYASSVAEKMQAAGLRVEVDERNEKIGAKIRDAIGRKIPYLLVVGEREAADGTVAVRPRDGEDRGAQPVDSVLAEISKLSTTRGREGIEKPG
ncbi:MAG: threonine--tRNA ligase [Planctomycetota bacterium]|jgi:threonyl-tRNA synthetase